MDSIEEQLEVLTEEYPQLDEARFAYTLHAIRRLKGNLESSELRNDLLTIAMEEKADNMIKKANSFRAVMGFGSNIDFFDHPDLKEEKKAVEDKIRRKNLKASSNNLKDKKTADDEQEMERQMEFDKMYKEKELKIDKLRDSLKDLVLDDTNETDGDSTEESRDGSDNSTESNECSDDEGGRNSPEL